VKDGSPDGYRALAALTRAEHPDHALAVLVKGRASRINNCRFCEDAHTAGALEAGVSDDRIAATADWQASDLFDGREGAALALTDLLTRSGDLARAEDPSMAPAWDAAAGAFPGDDLLQLVFTIAGINAWNRMMISEAVISEG